MIGRALLLAMLFSSGVQAGRAADSSWVVIEKNNQGQPILEYRRQAIGSPIQYVAVRASLDYFQLRLISARRLGADQSSDWQPNLQTLEEAWLAGQKPGTTIAAIAPAGFPPSIGSTFNVGLLKVDGIVDAPFQAKGPSAVFCLHSANKDYADYGYQVPTFYRPNDKPAQMALVNQCKDAVQAGPRILEDKSAPDAKQMPAFTFTGSKGAIAIPLGILPNERLSQTTYARTVFALDWPTDRPTSPGHQFGGRDAYLIVFPHEVHLFDVQTLLVSSEFYGNPSYYPSWAINLVGGVYAGMLIPSLDSKPEKDEPIGTSQVGKVDLPLSSAIALVRRPDR